MENRTVLQETLGQVAQELMAIDASLKNVLAPPLSEEKVRSSLADTGIGNTDFLVALYTVANGQAIEAGMPPLLWDGFYFLPLERSLVERFFNMETYSQLGLNSDFEKESAFGSHHLHAAWVPIGIRGADQATTPPKTGVH